MMRCHPSNKEVFKKNSISWETIYDEIIECVNDLNDDGLKNHNNI
jgi:hypothetical protein